MTRAEGTTSPAPPMCAAAPSAATNATVGAASMCAGSTTGAVQQLFAVAARPASQGVPRPASRGSVQCSFGRGLCGALSPSTVPSIVSSQPPAAIMGAVSPTPAILHKPDAVKTTVVAPAATTTPGEAPAQTPPSAGLWKALAGTYAPLTPANEPPAPKRTREADGRGGGINFINFGGQKRART